MSISGGSREQDMLRKLKELENARPALQRLRNKCRMRCALRLCVGLAIVGLGWDEGVRVYAYVTQPATVASAPEHRTPYAKLRTIHRSKFGEMTA